MATTTFPARYLDAVRNLQVRTTDIWLRRRQMGRDHAVIYRSLGLAMTLANYLRQTNTPLAIFARKNGFSIFTARKWLRGERTPRPKSALKIMKATGGKVTGDDWLPDADA